MGKRKTAVAVEHGNRLPEVAVISLSLVVSNNTMVTFLTGEVYIIVNTASQRKIWASSLQMNICCEIEMAPLLRAEVQSLWKRFSNAGGPAPMLTQAPPGFPNL